MNYLTRINDATAYPDGTKIKSKNDGSVGVIERTCGCGNGQWLHYEVMFNKGLRVYQHAEIDQLFEVIHD